MRNSLFILILSLPALGVQAQSGGIQQYYYPKTTSALGSITPIAHYTTANRWYGEARYNYDDVNTFSMYAGKTFVTGSDLSIEATPIAGGMVGNINGGSLGLNMDMEFRKLFFSSQSQYSMSFEDNTNRYFFSWSELGLQPLNWFYSGIAVQQTNIYGSRGQFDPGCMIGFNFGNWSVPVYAFNPSNTNRYFIVGLLFSWDQKKTNREAQTISEISPTKKKSN